MYFIKYILGTKSVAVTIQTKNVTLLAFFALFSLYPKGGKVFKVEQMSNLRFNK